MYSYSIMEQYIKTHSKYSHKIKKKKLQKSTSETRFVLIGTFLVYHTVRK